MKNRIKALGLCFLILMSFSGCSIPGFTQDIDDEDDYLFTKPTTSTKTEKNNETIEYKWLINPQIRAANIISFDGSQIDPDLKKNEAYKKYSIIYNDGKYGFIDYNGKKIVSPEYEHFYLCPCGEMVLYNILNSNEEYEYCTISSTGKISHTITKHDNTSSLYYWDSKSKKIYEKNTDSNFVTQYGGKNSVIALKTEITKLENGNFAASQQINPAYGLIKNNKIILDFLYENYYTSASEINNKSIIAFKQNEKWGYMNGKGKIIIPFSCNDILSSDCGEIIDFNDKLHPYLFSDGYLPVSTDSGYCYYDTNGNCVIPTGEFEQARPVHNGKAWVRQNGNWGIIQIGEIIEDEPPKTTKKKTSKTTTKKTTKKEKTTTKKKTSVTKKTTKKTVTKKKTQKITTTAKPLTTKKTKPITSKLTTSETSSNTSQSSQTTPSVSQTTKLPEPIVTE